MILLRLKEQIDSYGPCSRRQLADTFGLSEDGIEAMVEIWLKRGEIQRVYCLQAGQSQCFYKCVNREDIAVDVYL